MKIKSIAIYGMVFNDKYTADIQFLFDELIKQNIKITVYLPFLEILKNKISLPDVSSFQNSISKKDKVDALFSIGGDGTILESATKIHQSEIPIVGINTGRMGFLSTLQITDTPDYLKALLNGEYNLDSRNLITLVTDNHLFKEKNFALNELVIHKKDSTSMISIHTYLDDEFLCTYWADGLIISTPTGSTAYSMSCGGPITLPDANTFILNPIAPHNLNSRPLVIPNNKTITLRVEGRSKQFLVSLDSRVETIDASLELKVSKCDFPMNFVRLKDYSFLKTISKKLHWGYDQRN